MRLAKCLVTISLLATAVTVSSADPRPDPFAPFSDGPYIQAPSSYTPPKAYNLPKVVMRPLQPLPAPLNVPSSTAGLRIAPLATTQPSVTIAPSTTGDWTLVGLMSSGQQVCALFTSKDATTVVHAGDSLPDNKTIVAEIDKDSVVLQPINASSKAKISIGQSYTLTTTDAAASSNGSAAGQAVVVHL
jgi:hypothetical protein